MKNKQKIKVIKDGPYEVSGGIPLNMESIVIGDDNEPERWELTGKFTVSDTYSLCRCGRSKNKPFCDGSHVKSRFDGTETCGTEKYIDNVELSQGPALDLTYSATYCIEARFCHRGLGAWEYADDSLDPVSKKTAIEEACNCPSGALVAWDKGSNKPIEPELERSLSLVENISLKKSGPIWVKGGITIESADGINYEVRNRMTLCRCGKSKNKPLCDGAHNKIGFKAEYKS
jgi:CDGSH-type Zn-finger protein